MTCYTCRVNGKLITGQIKCILPGVLILLLVYCSKPEPYAPVAAKVGDRTITTIAFQRAYLPVIMYSDKFDSPQTRREVLNTLIGDKILAQEAERCRLDTFRAVQRLKRLAEQKALARKLYQEWVADQVGPVTEKELREAFRRSNVKLRVRHLFARTKHEADSLFQLLTTGQATFQELARNVFRDSVLRYNGGELGWISFGDLDETLEDTLYHLPPGRISHPTKSIYGWHILQVDDAQRQLIVTEDAFQQARKNLRYRILERREYALGRKIINDFMKAQRIQFNRPLARKVWAAVLQRLPRRKQPLKLGSPELTPGALTDLRQELQPHLRDTLVTFKDGAWTVAHFLNHLPEMKPRWLYRNLYVGTAYLIRDAALAKEGYRLGYDTDPAVKEEVQDRLDHFLAQLYVAAVADTLRFNEELARQYYEREKFKRYRGPDSLRIERIFFSDSAQAVRFCNLVRLGRKPETEGLKPIKVEVTPWLVTPSGNDSLDYQRALRSKIDVPLGPYNSPTGWKVIFLRVRKRWSRPFAEVRTKVFQAMERNRHPVVRRLLLERLRPKYHPEITMENVNALFAPDSNITELQGAQ